MSPALMQTIIFDKCWLMEAKSKDHERASLWVADSAVHSQFPVSWIEHILFGFWARREGKMKADVCRVYKPSTTSYHIIAQSLQQSWDVEAKPPLQIRKLSLPELGDFSVGEGHPRSYAQLCVYIFALIELREFTKQVRRQGKTSNQSWHGT